MHQEIERKIEKKKEAAPEVEVKKGKEEEEIKRKKGWMCREKGGGEFGKALNEREREEREIG